MTSQKYLIVLFILFLISCKGEKEPINGNSEIRIEQTVSTPTIDTAKIDMAKIALPKKVENSRFDEIMVWNLEKLPLSLATG